MTAYDVKCPDCGAENKDLFLEETEGRYLCECCHKEHQIKGFERPHKIAVFNMAMSKKSCGKT